MPGARHLGAPTDPPGTPLRPAFDPASVLFPGGSGLEPSPRPPSRPLIEKRSPLVLTVSLVLLLGALVWFLVRFAALRGWHALLCILFGFYLASTPLAPYIQTGCRALARIVTGVEL